MSGLVFPHISITGVPGGLGGNPAILTTEVLLFAYFLFSNIIDIITLAVAIVDLPREMRLASGDVLRRSLMSYAAPVSVLLSAYNEEEAVASTVQTLLAMRYPEKEVIVVNDGSTDGTLEELKKAFDLVPFELPPYVKFKTQPIRGGYRSRSHHNLRVIDKENGGKSDSLNAAINVASSPLIFVADADTVYAPDTLEEMALPFLQDARTVATGAQIGILNESTMRDGRAVHDQLPRSMLVRFQILEYLRAFLATRAGWAPINGLLIISGACGLWKKDVVVEAGGFAVDTEWEDLEMTVRLHHMLRAKHRPYRIAYVAKPVCWTSAPQRLAALQRQRISWHRHLTEVAAIHRRLAFRRPGIVEWMAFPNFLLVEWLGPVFVLGGLTFAVVCAALGILSVQAQLALLVLVFGLALLKAAGALLLDEVSFRGHRLRVAWGLFWAAILELIGFRQLIAVWNLIGIGAFLTKQPIRGMRKDTAGPLRPPYKP